MTMMKKMMMTMMNKFCNDKNGHSEIQLFHTILPSRLGDDFSRGTDKPRDSQLFCLRLRLKPNFEKKR